MPDNEDRAPAAGAGVASSLPSTVRLVDELVDALLGQVRRATRQSETASDLPRGGTKKALKELAADAASIEGHSAELREALGIAGEAAAPEPGVADASAADDAESSTDEIVRSLAIDLRLQGQSREEVRRRLEQTFGADQTAAVIDEVFDG
jgi:aminopeptidase N